MSKHLDLPQPTKYLHNMLMLPFWDFVHYWFSVATPDIIQKFKKLNLSYNLFAHNNKKNQF